MMARARRRRLDERELGDLIREARQFAGLSQTELADAVGTKQSVISRWERGRETPRADTLAKLLRACGYETDLVLRPRDTGVDRAQIRDMLRRSPTDRLREAEAMYEFVRSARRAS
jgi:transcriptional regulator with XRE-family HTH domain